jgi:hypothetical protein
VSQRHVELFCTLGDCRLAACTASLVSSEVIGHVDASPCHGDQPNSGANAPTTGSSTSR